MPHVDGKDEHATGRQDGRPPTYILIHIHYKIHIPFAPVVTHLPLGIEVDRKLKMWLCYLLSLLLSLGIVESFVPRSTMSGHQNRQILMASSTADRVKQQSLPRVMVCADVGKALCQDVINVARDAISTRGKCFIAVPGGSVLKLLSGLKTHATESGVDWNKVHLFYVNHKSVPSNDASATHFKAKSLFLDALKMTNVYPLDEPTEGMGHDTLSHSYEKKIRTAGVPLDATGKFPVFDYMLLGMGKDGHVGSLYPERKEVSESSRWVLSVDKKQPSSVTLSLPVMNAALYKRVVLLGEDKQMAALKGITKSVTPMEFPVCGIDSSALWMIDNDCSGKVVAAGVPVEKH